MAISAYFAVFATSAFVAAEPARTADSARCDAANVSGDVTSHLRHRPCAQGIIVTPSGRLWSDRLRPVGSLVAGIWARCRARHIASFNSLCLGWRPALLLQARPCVPRAFTYCPQMQSCGSQMLVPKAFSKYSFDFGQKAEKRIEKRNFTVALLAKDWINQ